MNFRKKLAIISLIIFVFWIGMTVQGICIFVDGPTPDWLGSHGGCGPYVTYEVQKYFGLLWYD